MTFTETCGWAATVLFFISYFPQLIRTYKLKTVDDISAPMWWVLIAAYSCLFTYGISLNSNAIMVNALLGFNCTGFMLVMYYLYRDPRKDRIRKIVVGFIKDSQRRFKDD